jgi:uncharacterized membrane protein
MINEQKTLIITDCTCNGVQQKREINSIEEKKTPTITEKEKKQAKITAIIGLIFGIILGVIGAYGFLKNPILMWGHPFLSLINAFLP